jgi:hypothetical protein
MCVSWRALWLMGMALTCAQAHADEALSVRIDKLFAAWNRPDSPGAAVLIVRDQVLHRRGYGQAQLEHAVFVQPRP